MGHINMDGFRRAALRKSACIHTQSVSEGSQDAFIGLEPNETFDRIPVIERYVPMHNSAGN